MRESVSASHLVKTMLLKLLPDNGEILRIAWHNRHIRRFQRRIGLDELAERFISLKGATVLEGPFKGMIYITQAIGSVLIPKLVGSYEEELHDVVTQLVATPYDVIVDIGCAEGYYAVGFARAIPAARVYAFDISPWGRKLCGKLAALNQVGARLEIAGRCDHEGLRRLLIGRGLVVCDCEGCEFDLLRPDLIPEMKITDLLVELHEHLQPGVTEALRDRFAATHHFHLIQSRERNPDCYPCLQFLELKQRSLALNEFRPEQQWAFIEAREHGRVTQEGV